MIVPVILCGGSGTRLWPRSRKLLPKQFLPLVGEKTMIQETVERLDKLENLLGDPIFITNEDHRFLVTSQMEEMGKGVGDVILEPQGRNTAPAIAVAAMEAIKRFENPLLLVLPADHHLEGLGEFKRAVDIGSNYAREGKLITFGIVPTEPETGYGYIKQGQKLGEGIFEVDKFVEKPDRDTASKYIKEGGFFWNSGMFLFDASVYLEELKSHIPEIYEKSKSAWEKGKRQGEFLSLDREEFLACPEDSIDYAVMERTKRACVVPLKCVWNDVGSWYSLWEIGEKDENENVVKGDIISIDTQGCYLDGGDMLLTTLGLQDEIVVITRDAVLISRKDRVQEVKKIVKKLKKNKREEVLHHKRVYRPWGSYETLELGDRYQVKRIEVKPGAILSLQKHFHRSEHWVVVQGTGKVTRNDEEILLCENQYVYLPLGCIHRIENPGKIPLVFIEVQVGSYLGEDDIVRLQDVYGRTKEDN